MLNINSTRYLLIVLSISSCIGFSSCVSTKKITYFRDLPDSIKLMSITTPAYTDPLIEPDDIMTVTFQTADPTASSLTQQQTAVGYLVDKDGFVELPFLGRIKLSGLTTYQARDTIRARALKDFVDPTVQVRFANYKVTVLGEVNKPGSYIIPNEKVSIMDAIALAGDMTVYSRRERVLLIREEEGKKKLTRLNLASSTIFGSPYFYLKKNDVIYVEPDKSKSVATDTSTRAVTIVISTISVLITLYYALTR